MKKYVFKSYDRNFPKLYNKEKRKLKRILPKNSKIEHIGSTAIPRLGGKGIIDIIIGVNKKDIDKVKNKLIKEKFKFKEKAGGKNRLFFEKSYKYKGKERRVHLQLTYFNSYIWKSAINFRECLGANKKAREEYTKIKKRAVKIAKQKGEIYRKYKKKFIKNILNKSKV